MHPLLFLSILLFGTSLASSPAENCCEELKQLKEHLRKVEEKVDGVINDFMTVHRARSFSTGSERLYTTNEQEGNFEMASATCIQAGGRIPSPKKEGENKFLQEVVQRRNKPAFLVGHKGEGYTNWADGEPNNAGGTKNCAEIDIDGKWHAASCEQAHLIVCEFAFIP
ncbi:phospholipase A2 inhibitor alpha-like protein [Pogona vitticeps]